MKRPPAVPRALASAAFLLLVVSCSPVIAGGPLYVTTEGVPVAWSTDEPVPYHPDQGGLGLLGNAEAVALADMLLGDWEGVRTATITFAPGAPIPVDVDETNFGPALGPSGGATEPLGMNVIVFDEDGAIFDTLFGVGTGIAGFANVAFFSDGNTTVPVGEPIPPGAQVIEGYAFLNGKMLDGIDDPAGGNPELSSVSFEAVILHEFGHFSGLAHTQIHGLRNHPPESDLPSLTQPVETMFSFIVDDGQRSLGRDDVVSLSVLYPTADFFSSTGSISGTVRTSDGTPLSGVNVIARNVKDESDAVSFVSGTNVVTPGRYSLHGLTPGESYRVEVEEVDAFARGSAGLPPFSEPITLPGPPESYNGADESEDSVIDDPQDFETIVARAGVTAENIDIILNSQAFSVANTFVDSVTVTLDLAVEDFDRDGNTDFVGAGTLSFYRGLGNGAFAAPVSVGAFSGNAFVVAGQFNLSEDEFPDIAVASVFSSNVRVYLGDGGGGFGLPTTVLNGPDGLGRLVDLVVGDLNDDSLPDLFTIIRDFTTGSATAYSLLGDGRGGFDTRATELAAGSDPPLGALSLANVMGSAAVDVIGIAGAGSTVLPAPPALGFLVGDGGGGVAPAPAFSLASITSGIEETSLGIGDLDQNGTVDVVLNDLLPVGGAENFTRSWIDILLGDGNGSFVLSESYFVPEIEQSGIVLVDLDRDGNLDIASTGPGAWNPGAKVHVAFGDGAGAVEEVGAIWGLGEFPSILTAAHLDADDRPDLLVSQSRVGVGAVGLITTYAALLNQLEPVFVSGFIRGDVDGDGVLNGLVDTLYLLRFQFQDGTAPPCLEASDVDGDGILNGLVDALHLLRHVFQDGSPPTAPYPGCDPDPDPRTSVGCASAEVCD